MADTLHITNKTTDMLPTSFKGSNFVFTKPQGWTDEQCMDLPVFKGNAKDEDGSEIPVIISCWRMSKEDLEEIQKTGCVYLSITGTGMPPVSLFTESPFVGTDVE
jgi:hypothetical protein